MTVIDKPRDTLIRSSLYGLLVELDIVRADKVALYAPRVRDRDDVKAYRCTQSGVIFLDRTDHMSVGYYTDKEFDDSLNVGERKIPLMELDNAERQIRRFGNLLEGKDWLDFGCGAGAMQRKFGSRAKSAIGVEPARWHREAAKLDGVAMVESLDAVADRRFDVITLFHVFEHLLDPIGMAQALKERLKPGGLLLIEVPHARDFLLETLDSAPFRAFTLWSEHLILHTRQSLDAFLRKAGFASVEVKGLQRYPLSNHLYWLRHGQPGGHQKWPFVDTPELAEAYEVSLDRIDQTDTIIGYARA